MSALPSTKPDTSTATATAATATAATATTATAATATAATATATTATTATTTTTTATTATTTTLESNASAQGKLSPTSASASAELASLKIDLHRALRQFEDFPTKGIIFEDILPIFANPALHAALIRALELHVLSEYKERPDVIVGLDARGFLFGPSLALRLGAGFVPVRKKGKLPGPCETAEFEKEYGADFFQMQSDGVRAGQKVLVVDDIIATGGSASAAGSLVKKLGGTLLGYIFILELDFLKGRAKLDAPVYTLLSTQ